MPNRWLRDSILASRRLAELSDFAERLSFDLLIVSTVDRVGRTRRGLGEGRCLMTSAWE